MPKTNVFLRGGEMPSRVSNPIPIPKIQISRAAACVHCRQLFNKSFTKACSACIIQYNKRNVFTLYRCELCSEDFQSKYPWVTKFCVNCHVRYCVK
jgi:hypothetical protein